jgi:hypothetical protein
VYIDNLQNGSKLVKNWPTGDFLIPALGPVASQTVTKSAGDSMTSNGIELNRTGKEQLARIDGHTSLKFKTHTIYYITYDLSNLDQIVLRFNVTSYIHPQLNYRTDHIAAIKVKVRAAISGDAIQ